MAQTDAPAKQAGGKGTKSGRGKTRSTAPAEGAASAESHEDVLPEWDETPEDLTALPDIDGLISKPAANAGNDPEARRRIEMLREERLLQQALSDIFDL